MNLLEALASRAEAAGLLLDFDGSLAEIVATPEEARPVSGAREVLAGLARKYRLVAVVSGRPTDDLAGLLDVEGVTYEGLYGLDSGAETPLPLRGRVEALVQQVPGARVEWKGLTLAVHYRGVPDAEGARNELLQGLTVLAGDEGMEVIEGKMVLELVPAGESRKGGAVRRLVTREGLAAVLYAGDDLPDLEAFAELDRLASEGAVSVKVVVAGEETPEELVRAADVVVRGPRGLVELLRSL